MFITRKKHNKIVGDLIYSYEFAMERLLESNIKMTKKLKTLQGDKPAAKKPAKKKVN